MFFEDDKDVYQDLGYFHWITNTMAILTILVNGQLFYVVYRYSSPEIGNYKYLIMCFSTFAIFYAGIDIIVQPVCYCFGSAFGFFPSSFLRHAPREFQIITSLHPGAYSMSQFLLMLHFIYRYMVVYKRHQLQWFTYPRCLIWVASFILYSGNFCLIIFFVFQPNEVYRSYLKKYFINVYKVNIDNVYFFGGQYFEETPAGKVPRWKDFLTILNLITLLQIVMVTIFYIFFKMAKAMRELDITMSKRLKQLQIQFFRALSLQLFIPLVTAFFPIGMLYFCPLLDIEMGFYSNIISILLSFQMLLDACVTFTVIKDYRKALMRIFFRNIVNPFLGKNRIEVNNSSNFMSKSDPNTQPRSSSQL
ncbi:hypothetical protein WR25_20138 [Diploscapter pachys]|uniref:G-protein coupled receptors family 1 profile domain-containing protein n=1 Tax=Diploscapter pachys TaxID=2018661 RepID=A0A2A2LR61_9BILA|nr:hypothetical protein WR25_20138 [Diploscapter pachys]